MSAVLAKFAIPVTSVHTTSTMIITTPGTTSVVHGMRYMSFLGLFLFKDVISLGASLYLISYFGKEAILSENKN
jgi:uncharacterized membrane protein YkgB